jgi:hypothetical protein
MSPTLQGRPIRAALMLLALCACALAFTSTASAKHKQSERVVVRGDGTVGDSCGPAGCDLQTTGSFRGTLGSGGYAGAIELQLPDAFPNGEGGLCAPIRGQIVLGAGTPDRLTLAVSGDSCQDGAGPPPLASFTGLADWVVVKGTGTYAHARGSGTATFLEDAADQERMTLIGRIAR